MSGRDDLMRTVREAEWMAQVLAWARAGHWDTYHTFDSRHSTAGFPDLVLARTRADGEKLRGEVLFVELKRETGEVTREQRRWLYTLDLAGCEVAVWRPSHAEAVRARLLGEGR